MRLYRPIIQKRLLEFIYSLQMLAMTCGACSKCLMTNAHATGLWKDRLAYIKANGRYESVVFESLEIISQYSPLQKVRQIYGQLLGFLLWSYPLRIMHGSRKEVNEFSGSLERRDGDSLAAEMENLLLYELQFAAALLEKMGIKAASGLVIPCSRAYLPTETAH